MQMRVALAVAVAMTILLAATASSSAAEQPAARGFRAAYAASHKGLGPAVPVPSWARGKAIHFLPSTDSLRRWRHREALLGGAGPSEGEDEGAAYYIGCPPSQSACGPLRYNEAGEGVQHAPDVHLIFWGSNWTKGEGLEAKESLEAMFGAIGNSDYQGILTQYFDPTGRISKSVSFDSYVDERVTAPTEAEPPMFTEEADEAIEAMSWPVKPDAQFIVLPAPGTEYGPYFGNGDGFCGFHAYGHGYSYAVVPFPGDEPFQQHCGGSTAKARREQLQHAASHEYAETATNPIPSASTSSWLGRVAYGVTNYSETEIGDICLYKGALPNGLTVTKLWDNTQDRCSDSDPAPAFVYANTEPATSVRAEEATLGGTVNPEKKSTTYRFEYGTSAEYGSTVPVNGAGAGAGQQNVAVSAQAEGLAAETTYHYRLVATNSTGTDYGADEQFATSAWVRRDSKNSGLVKLEAVDCPATSWCVVLGQRSNGKTRGLTFAGGDWSNSGAYTPPEAATVSVGGVSCGAVRSCVAVGDYEKTSGGTYPVAWASSGGFWSKVELTLPPDAAPTLAFLRDISCVTPSWCVATGSYYSQTDHTTKTLVDVWNGTEWEPRSSGNPAGVLNSVSCASTEACVAVGSVEQSSDTPIVQRWDGSSWSVGSPVVPSGGGSRLMDVSCPSASRCLAVGEAGGSASERLAERWDGTQWSLVAKGGRPLSDLSCSSESACIGVGRGASGEAMAELWSGEAWAPLNPAPSLRDLGSSLSAVSCGGQLVCMAVGAEAEGGATATPLAYRLPASAAPTATTEGVDAQLKVATLHGTVNPNGADSEYFFEYGEVGKLSGSTPVPYGSVGEGAGPVEVSVETGVLVPAREYGYRLAATNGDVTIYGAERRFIAPGATTLCSTTSLFPCSAEDHYEATTLTASLAPESSFEVGGASFSVSCGSSEAALTTKDAVGEPLGATLGVSLSNCGGSCSSASSPSFPQGASVQGTAFKDGRVSLAAGLRFDFKGCTLFKVSCSYATADAVLALEGDAHAPALEAESIGLTKTAESSGLCPGEVSWRAAYVLDEAPLYVGWSSYPAALCSAEEEPCGAGSAYAAGQALAGESASLSLTGGSFAVTCASALSGEVGSQEEEALAVQLSTLSLSGCGGSCQSAAASNLPYSGKVSRTGDGDGSLRIEAEAEGGEPAIQLQGCTLFGVSCRYAIPTDPLGIEGGNPAHLIADEVSLARVESSSVCPSTVKLSGEYGLTTPAPLWVSGAVPTA